MLEKVSSKKLFLFFLISGIAIFLSTCSEPVNLGNYLNDPAIQQIVSSTQQTVTIDPSSDDFGKLTAGDQKIIGLTPSRYYKIEEMEDDAPVATYFVKADGTLSLELKDIRKLNKHEITELTNNVTYRVKYAQSYTNTTNTIKYFYLDNSSTQEPFDVTNGAVTIYDGNKNQGIKYKFNVADKIDPTKDYIAMKINTSGTANQTWDKERTSARRKTGGNVINTQNDDESYTKFRTLDIGIFQYETTSSIISPLFLKGMSIMDLPTVNTVNDYVFVEYDEDNNTKDFYVLTVSVKPAGSGTITIAEPELPTPSDDMITLTYKSGTNITNGASITILSGDTEKTITASGGTSYGWFIITNTKTPISTEGSINIGTDTHFPNPGIYTIMVEGTVESIVYSKWFILIKE